MEEFGRMNEIDRANEINRENEMNKPNEGKPKKKGGFKKFLLLILSGILLGSVAGVTFYGTTLASRYYDPFGKVLSAMGFAIEEKEEGRTEEKTGDNQDDDRIESTQTTPILQTSGKQEVVTVTDVSDIVDNVMPALVSIVNEYTETQSFGYFGSYEQTYKASGSGIIVGQSDEELLLVTNYHVVEDADRLLITFVDETSAEAVIKGSNQTMDLAVIAVPLSSLDEKTKNDIAIATLGDSASLKVGEPAIAIGNALGYGQSVTTGVISALNRELTVDSTSGATGTFIQTDAAINQGNSGGALLNMKGEVIGINSRKIGGTVVEGMGYAIPISAAKPIIEDLLVKADRAVVAEEERGYLGVTVTNMTDNLKSDTIPAGAYIDKVSKESAADKAGLMAGDIIVQFGDDEIQSMSDLQKALCYYRNGQTISVTVQRRDRYGDYSKVTAEVTLQNSAG